MQVPKLKHRSRSHHLTQTRHRLTHTTCNPHRRDVAPRLRLGPISNRFVASHLLIDTCIVVPLESRRATAMQDRRGPMGLRLPLSQVVHLKRRHLNLTSPWFSKASASMEHLQTIRTLATRDNSRPVSLLDPIANQWARASQVQIRPHTIHRACSARPTDRQRSAGEHWEILIIPDPTLQNLWVAHCMFPKEIGHPPFNLFRNPLSALPAIRTMYRPQTRLRATFGDILFPKNRFER